MSALGLARVAVRAGTGNSGVRSDARGPTPDTEWVSLDLSAFPPGTHTDRLREHFGEPEAVQTVRKLIGLPVLEGQDPEATNVQSGDAMRDEDSPGKPPGDEADAPSRVVEREEWFYRVAPEQDERPTDWLVFEVYEHVVQASRVQPAGPGTSSAPPGAGDGTPELAPDGGDLTDALLDATGDDGGDVSVVPTSASPPETSGDEALTVPEPVARTEPEPEPEPELEPESVDEAKTAAEADQESVSQEGSDRLPVGEPRTVNRPVDGPGSEPVAGDALALARQRAASRPLRPGRWGELDDEFPDAPAFDDLVTSVLSEVRRPER